MIHIERTWRVLWAGRLRARLPGRRFLEIEWGPPFIWIPRFDKKSGRISNGDAYGGFDVGFAWWILRYACVVTIEEAADAD